MSDARSMEPIVSGSRQVDQSLELSLKDIIDFFLKYWLHLFCSVILFTVLGISYSFTLKKQYKAETVILPEMGSNEKRGLSSLAMGLASLGLNTGEKDAVRPDLYPSFINSTNAYLYLLEQPVQDREGKTYSKFRDYLKSLREEKSESWLSFLSTGSKSVNDTISLGENANTLILLSKEERYYLKYLSSRIESGLELRNGVINISVEMRDPVVASMVLNYLTEYLSNFVKQYRTGKVQEQHEFIKESLSKTKAELESVRMRLQSYRDSNRNPFLNTARIGEQRLMEEFNLLQNKYQGLSMELAQTSVKLDQEPPVFQVLEPNIVPLDKSSPRRLRIGLLFGILGGILTFLYLTIFKEKVLQRLYAGL